MSNENSGTGSPDKIAGAVVKTASDSGFSPIWIIPIVAVVIGLYLVYQLVSQTGPTITITFKEGYGVEVGKTKVKFKDIEVGSVSDVSLTKDMSGVVVTVDIDKSAEKLITDKAKFWVVRPQVSAGSITGLNTLLSGAYIGIDPSKDGVKAKSFTGLERPPVIEAAEPGTRFKLTADQLGGIDFGTSIYYKQIVVGHVVDYSLNKNGSIDMDIFIAQPYDQFVNQATRFWNAGGIDVQLSAAGLQINTESVVAVVSGGIAFDTAKTLNLDASTRADPGTAFYLYRNRADSEQKQYAVTMKWLLYFDDPVRGLLPGAPVELRGYQIGEVVDINFELDQTKGSFKIPVLIEIQPERIALQGKADKQATDMMVAKGLRAQLKTGNIVLGKLLVDLDFHPEAEPATIDYSGPIPVFPTIKGSIGEILTDARVLIAELREVGKSINRTLDSPEFKTGAADLSATLGHINSITAQLDEKSAPEIAAVLTEAAATLEEARTMFAAESTTRAEISQLLIELAEAARSVRTLADYLEQNPESLIRGKD